MWETIEACYQKLGTVVATRPKRYEAIGLVLVASAAIFELTIATNNTHILNAKFDGIVERLNVLASTADYVVECKELKLDCGKREKTVLYPELFSDQAVPQFYQSDTAVAGKLIMAVFGTFLIFLGKWFEGFKAPEKKPEAPLAPVMHA
jgi:hypothetical protein